MGVSLPALACKRLPTMQPPQDARGFPKIKGTLLVVTVLKITFVVVHFGFPLFRETTTLTLLGPEVTDA